MTDTPNMAEIAAAMLEDQAPILEAIAGYKARLITLGFSSQSAEMMAVDFHHHLLELIRTNDNG